MPKPKDASNEYRRKAETALRTALTFLLDGSNLDAIMAASQAIGFMTQAYAARWGSGNDAA